MAYQVKSIRQMYLTLLQRYPSNSEVTYWLHFLAAGGTDRDIRRDLIQTREFEHELRSRFQSRHRRPPCEVEMVSLLRKAEYLHSLDEMVSI